METKHFLRFDMETKHSLRFYGRQYVSQKHYLLNWGDQIVTEHEILQLYTNQMNSSVLFFY